MSPVTNHHGLAALRPLSPPSGHEALSPPEEAPVGVPGEATLGRDLMLLAARLQETLADPQAQEHVLLETIQVRQRAPPFG